MTERQDFTIGKALPAFDRWDELLGVICASFAYMDGVIDPPSSAHRLTVSSLREKAAAEVCLLAMAGVSEGSDLPLSVSGFARATSPPLRGGEEPGLDERRPRHGISSPPRSGGEAPSEARRRGGEHPVCDPGGKIIGCAFLADRGDRFYLGKLAVLPAWQGKRVGRALMAAAEAEALRSGKPLIELQTRVELTANHRAFAALGFAETGRTAHPGYDRPTSVTMRKALA